MHSPRHFTRDSELFARRRQHVRGRVLRQERCREHRARFEEVLAVVEHEQRSLVRQRGDQLLDGLEPGNVMRSHRGQDS